MFSGSNFSMVPLPVSRDVDIRHKSEMAVAKMKRTDFVAVWLKEYNFQYPVIDFKCPRTQGNKQTTTYVTCRCHITKRPVALRPKPEVVIIWHRNRTSVVFQRQHMFFSGSQKVMDVCWTIPILTCMRKTKMAIVVWFGQLSIPRIFNTLFLLHSPTPRPASPKLHRPTAIALA